MSTVTANTPVRNDALLEAYMRAAETQLKMVVRLQTTSRTYAVLGGLCAVLASLAPGLLFAPTRSGNFLAPALIFLTVTATICLYAAYEFDTARREALDVCFTLALGLASSTRQILGHVGTGLDDVRDLVLTSNQKLADIKARLEMCREHLTHPHDL